MRNTVSINDVLPVCKNHTVGRSRNSLMNMHNKNQKLFQIIGGEMGSYLTICAVFTVHCVLDKS